MNPIRTLIVDDEVHARRGLRTLLADVPDVEVVGEAGDGAAAVECIRAQKPDLVFLDVEMPGRSGLEVVAEIGAEAMPLVVFVTAYDQYAVAAFETSALDYVLKPFTRERFIRAMDRARRQLRDGDTRALEERIRQVLAATGTAPLTRFTVKVGDTLQVFAVDDIDWIEADEYYVKLHIGDKAHIVRQTMGALEERLPADRFVRIHRSTIVNVERVVALEPLFQGEHSLVLRDGTRLRISRRRREALSELLTNLS